MSDNRRVIKVKDLVIEAENVFIEPKGRPSRDPFFGRRDRLDAAEDRMESSSKERYRDESGESRDDRRPFSWI